jgi:hypothetical protein
MSLQSLRLIQDYNRYAEDVYQMEIAAYLAAKKLYDEKPLTRPLEFHELTEVQKKAYYKNSS